MKEAGERVTMFDVVYGKMKEEPENNRFLGCKVFKHLTSSSPQRSSETNKMEEITAEDQKEQTGISLFHQLMVQRKKKMEEDAKMVLQRLIVIARLRHDLSDRKELGAHHEKLNFQLNKQYVWDPMTGLLLIYPSCLLHVIESSGVVLDSVVNHLEALQQQPDNGLLEVKIVFVAHNLQSRLFQQWSYKLLDENQVAADAALKRLEEEESTELLVCSVLSALKKLGEHLGTPQKVLPGSVLDDAPDLIIPEKTLKKLLGRDELLSPQQYLHMYKFPLKINIEFGHINLRSILSSI